MKALNDVKVGPKLIFGFLIVIAMSVILGVVAVRDMNALDNLVDELYTKRVAAISAIDDISYLMTELRAAAQTLPTCGQVNRDALITTINTRKQKIREKIQSLDGLLTTDNNTAILRNVQSEFSNLEKAIINTINVTKEHKTELSPELYAVLNDIKMSGEAAIAYTSEMAEQINAAAMEAWQTSSDTYQSGRDTLIIILILSTVIGLLIGFFLSRSISKPLNKTVLMLNEMKKGLLGTRLRMDRNDEIGLMAQAMDGFAQEMQENIVGTMHKISNGDLSANLIPHDANDQVIPVLMGTIETLRSLIIEDGGKVLHAAAGKDLSVRVQREYKGEFARMKADINAVVHSLDEAMSNVAEAVEQVSSASGEISSGAQSLAEGANEQASALQEVSSSLEEMSSMTKQNADNSTQVKRLVMEASASVEEANEAMKRMAEAIGHIKASSDNTAKILKTIDDIAFQTNLLALNAAVEAARAGEAGKGFAVVAEEVRNLAMRSAEASKSTAKMIEDSVKNADNGVIITKDVAKALDITVERTGRVTTLVAEIAAASTEQAQGIEQINTAVAQMNQVTQQNAANSEESASAAEELSSQAAELNTMVGGFTLSSHTGGSMHISKPRQQSHRQMRNLPIIKSIGTKTAKTVKAEEIIPLDNEDLADF